MAALLALVSAFCYGVSDFSGGLASRRMAATTVVLASNLVSLVLGVLVVTLLPGSVFRAADIGWGVAAGSVGLLGVVLLYRGLAIGPMAVVAPLTAVLSAVVPVVVGGVRGERPSTLAIAGVTLAVPAMALISRDHRAGNAGTATSPASPRRGLSRAALVAALCAGISFGGFYVLIAQTGPDGGAWPLVGQRAASVLLLLPAVVAAALRGNRAAPAAGVLLLAAIAGVTDFSANLAYVLASHRGLLALVAVISSLYPATTVLLARAVLAERLARLQVLGLILAGTAVGLIAVR